MENKEMIKIWEEAGEAFIKVSEILKEGYQKSFWFRCWIKWDNFKFIIKEFFKKPLPNYIGYIIFWIKNPRLRKIATWRK